MVIKDFQDLLVWQKAHKLTLEIYKLTRDFPQEEKFGVISQLRRAAVSVCANIAEGHRKSTKDFLRFLDISRGSLEEVRYFLILAKDLGFFDEERFIAFVNLSDEVGKMLNGLKQGLGYRLGR